MSILSSSDSQSGCRAYWDGQGVTDNTSTDVDTGTLPKTCLENVSGHLPRATESTPRHFAPLHDELQQWIKEGWFDERFLRYADMVGDKKDIDFAPSYVRFWVKMGTADESYVRYRATVEGDKPVDSVATLDAMTTPAYATHSDPDAQRKAFVEAILPILKTIVYLRRTWLSPSKPLTPLERFLFNKWLAILPQSKSGQLWTGDSKLGNHLLRRAFETKSKLLFTFTTNVFAELELAYEDLVQMCELDWAISSPRIVKGVMEGAYCQVENYFLDPFGRTSLYETSVREVLIRAMKKGAYNTVDWLTKEFATESQTSYFFSDEGSVADAEQNPFLAACQMGYLNVAEVYLTKGEKILELNWEPALNILSLGHLLAKQNGHSEIVNLLRACEGARAWIRPI